MKSICGIGLINFGVCGTVIHIKPSDNLPVQTVEKTFTVDALESLDSELRVGIEYEVGTYTDCYNDEETCHTSFGKGARHGKVTTAVASVIDTKGRRFHSSDQHRRGRASNL